MNELIQYTELKTPSGLSVSVRPRSYMEWETGEEKRLEYIQKMQDARLDLEGVASNAEIVRLFNEIRGERLALQVKDFARLKDKLSLGDVAFLEEEIARLEGITVPLGN